jgi:hypothetical protein
LSRIALDEDAHEEIALHPPAANIAKVLETAKPGIISKVDC